MAPFDICASGAHGSCIIFSSAGALFGHSLVVLLHFQFGSFVQRLSGVSDAFVDSRLTVTNIYNINRITKPTYYTVETRASGLFRTPASKFRRRVTFVWWMDHHQNQNQKTPYSILDCLFKRNQPVCSAKHLVSILNCALYVLYISVFIERFLGLQLRFLPGIGVLNK